MDNDNDYAGTLSSLTRYGTMNTPSLKTGRERKGKYRANRQRPRDRTIALSDTLVTRADGTTYTIAKGTRRAPTTRKPRTVTVKRDAGTDYYDRLARFGAVGNID